MDCDILPVKCGVRCSSRQVIIARREQNTDGRSDHEGGHSGGSGLRLCLRLQCLGGHLLKLLGGRGMKDGSQYLLDSLGVSPKLFCPGVARMDNIPVRAVLLFAAVAEVMVAEAIYGRIPQRQVLLNGAALTQADPDVIHHEKAAEEVRELQVNGLLNRRSVVFKAVVERRSDSRI